MKYLIFTIAMLISIQTFAQQKKDAVYLTAKDIVGVWQRNTSKLGSDLNQNFVFYKNGIFILNLTNNDEDVRNIFRLKGRYRLNKDEIYFTIISRFVMDGEKIITGDSSIDGYIFSIDGTKLKEVPESNPQELEPCYISMPSKNCIKINNEKYCKTNVTFEELHSEYDDE